VLSMLWGVSFALMGPMPGQLGGGPWRVTSENSSSSAGCSQGSIRVQSEYDQGVVRAQAVQTAGLQGINWIGGWERRA
jgi:hypothetical protein